MKFPSLFATASLALLVSAFFADAQQPAPAAAETPAGKQLSFEVATIKPAAPIDMQKFAADMRAGTVPKFGPQIGASRANYNNMQLNGLIAIAYNVRLYQIDGPSWLNDQRYDIEATMPEGATKNDAPAMLRALLEDRFKLTTHRAQQEHKVLALVASKAGVKMKEAAAAPQAFDPDSPLKPGEQQMEGLDGPVRLKFDADGTITRNMGARGTIVQRFDRQSMTMHFTSDAVNMDGFAEMLSNLLLMTGGANSRQVVDKSGLKGYYQIDVEIPLADVLSMARSQGFNVPQPPPGGGVAGTGAVPEASDPGGGASLFQSVKQMGLKLEDQSATVDRLVIDHMEKTPTEN